MPAAHGKENPRAGTTLPGCQGAGAARDAPQGTLSAPRAIISTVTLWGRRLGVNAHWTRSDRVVLVLAAMCAALDAFLFSGWHLTWPPAVPIAYVLLAFAAALERVPAPSTPPVKSPYRVPTAPPEQSRKDSLLGMRFMLWPYVVLNLLALLLALALMLLLKSLAGSGTFIA
jgi:hypothetical protein